MRTIQRDREGDMFPVIYPLLLWVKTLKNTRTCNGDEYCKQKGGSDILVKPCPTQLNSCPGSASCHTAWYHNRHISVVCLFCCLPSLASALIDIKKYILLRYFVSLMSGTWRFYEAPPIYRHQTNTKKKNEEEK